MYIRKYLNWNRYYLQDHRLCAINNGAVYGQCLMGTVARHNLEFQYVFQNRVFSVCYVLKVNDFKYAYIYKNLVYLMLFLSLNCSERSLLNFSILSSQSGTDFQPSERNWLERIMNFITFA